MPSRIEADIDFFLQFMRSHDDFVQRPHVIVLRKEGRIAALLPGRLERQVVNVRVGYKNLKFAKVNQIGFVGQLLGEDTPESAAEIMKAVKCSLRNGDCDVVNFHQVDSESSIWKIVERAGGILSKSFFSRSEENWRAQISGDYEAFLKSRSSNTRHNIKRYSKRLLKEFPDKLEYKIFRNLADIDTIFKDCETVAALSYHRTIGVGFFDNKATREIFALAATHGWLRSYVLYIEGRPRAFWNGFLYRDVFLAWDTAFDSSLSETRPGLYLLQRLIEDVCAVKSVREIDFGTGSAQYKRDICDVARLRMTKQLFAPTPKMILANLVRVPLLVISKTAKWVVVKSGLLLHVKKLWKKKLTASATTDTKQDDSAAA